MNTRWQGRPFFRAWLGPGPQKIKTGSTPTPAALAASSWAPEVINALLYFIFFTSSSRRSCCRFCLPHKNRIYASATFTNAGAVSGRRLCWLFALFDRIVSCGNDVNFPRCRIRRGATRTRTNMALLQRHNCDQLASGMASYWPNWALETWSAHSWLLPLSVYPLSSL